MKILNDHTDDDKSSWDVKHSTQFMSLFVGGLLIFMGTWGVFFDGIFGTTHQIFYWLAVIASGLSIGYFGYKDNRKASYLTCAFWGLMFLGLGLWGGIDFSTGESKTYIMANYRHQGSVDFVTSIIISFFLFAGAIDWWRRAHNKPVKEKHVNEVLTK